MRFSPRTGAKPPFRMERFLRGDIGPPDVGDCRRVPRSPSRSLARRKNTQAAPNYFPGAASAVGAPTGGGRRRPRTHASSTDVSRGGKWPRGTSDSGRYVVWNRFVCPLSVVGSRTVPFIVEETAPDTGEVNSPVQDRFGPERWYRLRLRLQDDSVLRGLPLPAIGEILVNQPPRTGRTVPRCPLLAPRVQPGRETDGRHQRPASPPRRGRHW